MYNFAPKAHFLHPHSVGISWNFINNHILTYLGKGDHGVEIRVCPESILLHKQKTTRTNCSNGQEGTFHTTEVYGAAEGAPRQPIEESLTTGESCGETEVS